MDAETSILIVDDDPDIREVLRLLLTAQGYRTLEAADGLSAIRLAMAHPELDLILLDIRMPDMDGYQTCDGLRVYTNAPILFLTAMTGEDDRLEAYRRGGDDFLSKPFSQPMLLAKVTSLLRRYREYRGKPETEPTADVITLDPQRRTVSRDGETFALTEKEYGILSCLLQHRGAAVSTQELYETVWGERYLPASANTVMVHMLKLRKKLETDPSAPKLIRTVWGKGYQIDSESPLH